MVDSPLPIEADVAAEKRAIAPTVFAAVPKRRWRVTVAAALQDSAWVHHIVGAHSWRLVAEFVDLSERLQGVQLVPGVPDTFAWTAATPPQLLMAPCF